MKKSIIFLLGVILFFIGCKEDNTSNNVNKSINIGLLLPLTGNGANYGKSVQAGALLALNEFNSTKFRLIKEDTKTTVKDGLAGAKKIIDSNNASMLLGPMSSGVAKAVGNFCQTKKVIMITTASAPNISKLGEYVYRIYPSDSYDGNFLADKILEQNLSNSIIIYMNNDFGIGMVEVFQKTYEANGGKIIEKLPFSPDQQSFKVLVSKLKNKMFDNLFIVATQKEYINIINDMEQINIMNIPIFAPVNIEDKEIVEKISSQMLKYIQYSKPIFNLDRNSTKTQQHFKNLWERHHNEKANIFNAYGYDLVSLANKIINHTKDGNYKKTLSKIGKIEGATGTYRFDKDGDVIRSFSLLKLKDF